MTVKLVTLMATVAVAVGPKTYVIVCPSPIKQSVGNDATVSCNVDPLVNLSTEVLDFKREDFNKTIVHSYRHTPGYPGQQASQYVNRTSLDYEDLGRGILKLKILSAQQSDSGRYKIYISTLKAYSFFNIEVVQTDQQNRTIKNESSTTGPPKEGVPEPDKPDNHGATVSIGVVAAAAVGVPVAAVAAVAVFVKSGKFWTCLKKLGVMKREEKEATNNIELNNLMGPAREGEDQRSAAQHGLRAVVVADGPSVP